jgi:hypothetical protein
MKTPLLLSLLLIVVSAGIAQECTYTRLYNGLDDPTWETGRSDFCIDDINMDGHPDIITIGDHGSPLINCNQHGICVWFGDGQGNFENVMSGNFGYGGICAGDVNGDGFKDVGYGMHHNYGADDFGDQLLEVALGDGTGQNWTPWDDGLGENGELWGMFGTDFGDVDNDGDLDLVSNNFGETAGVRVYLNKGDGSWEQSFVFPDGNSCLCVQLSDFDNDGFLDFIVAHEGGSLFFGDGTGNFVNKETGLPPLPDFMPRRAISAADVDNDGAAEIAILSPNSGLRIYDWNREYEEWINSSNGLPDLGNFSFSDLIDLNADGFVDLIGIENENISVWYGDGNFNWEFITQFSLGEPVTPRAFRVAGDLDHNGRPDIVTLGETGIWPDDQNILFCYTEDTPAENLTINPGYPKGGENFYPGSVRFIEWQSELPSGETSTVDIEISAYGPEGPWWMLAENIPNNGRHQWTVPEYGSEDVYLKFTVQQGNETAFAITPEAFNILGTPTSVNDQKPDQIIQIYPNPGRNIVFINHHTSIRNLTFTDLSGRECLDIACPGPKLDVSHLINGIYFYRYFDIDGNIKTGKWVKY